MRDFIVLTAVLPLLLVFTMQFAADFKSSEETETIRNLVYAAKETARQEGGFSEELRDKLCSDIEERLNLQSGAVSVEISDSPGTVGRFDTDNRIEYVVSVTLCDVMAGSGFFGISDEENRRVYVIDSYTSSEYVGGY